MITKNDCLVLLAEITDSKVNEIINKVLINGVTSDIVEYINSFRQLDAQKFYEKLRKSYNDKKSNLYKNIVKEEIRDPKELPIILASLNLQILLFSKTVEDQKMFLSHLRFDEINKCLLNFYNTGDLTLCVKLLDLFKSDLKVFESYKK